VSDSSVTVGVPVHNGAALLSETLAGLARQTHRDLRVIVADNGSTDATPDIAARFARADSRFEHRRRETVVPPAENFRAVLALAETETFLWRAHDDTASDDFIAETRALLIARPQAVLAAAAVRQERPRPDGTLKTRAIPFRLTEGPPGSRGFAASLRTMHQGWFYGLWRTAAVTAIWDRVWAAYPHAWASDFLMLLAALSEGGIAGTNRATFVQRLVAKPGRHASQTAPRGHAVLAARRAAFLAAARAECRAETLPPLPRLRFALDLDLFASRRLCSRRRLLLARLGRG
jgi:glycosyltransferase involved in cell wall biosynthesis